MRQRGRNDTVDLERVDRGDCRGYGRARNHERDLATLPIRLARGSFSETRQRAAIDTLVNFGELARDGSLAFGPEHERHIGERLADAMRCLEEHHRPRFAQQLRQARTPLAGFCRQKALETETLGGNGRDRQSRCDGGGAGNPADGDSRRRGTTHEIETRIRQQRRTGIAHERHDGALLQAANQLIATGALVVRVQRDHRFLQAERREQRTGTARIFNREQIGARQAVARPGRQIGQIADRRRDHLEPTDRRGSCVRPFRRTRWIAHYNHRWFASFARPSGHRPHPAPAQHGIQSMICPRACSSLPTLLLWLLATITLAACGPIERAPLASPERAAAFAERGDHAAAANEYESLAAGTIGSESNGWRLSAIEQWLLADRVEPATKALGLLAAPLDPGQTIERDRLNIELLWRRDGAANAWPAMTSLTAPDAATQRTARARFFELRQRLALANALPVEAVRSALEREKLAADASAVPALRTALLSELRTAIDAGLRIDPRLAGRDAMVRGWLEAASLAARAARVPASGNAAITAAWQRRYPNHPARAALIATHLDASPATMAATMPATEAASSAAASRAGSGAGTGAGAGARTDAGTGADAAHVAVLLPLSGRLASAGHDVRDGLIAAHFAYGADAPALRFYDTANATDASAMRALIDRAVAAGAKFLIGPLGRDEVAFAAGSPNTVPQLLLNVLPTTIPSPAAPADSAAQNAQWLWQYALSPEEEATLAAQRALAANQRRAIILLQNGEWATRVGAAFRSTFEAGGGRVLAQESLAEDSGAAIEKALRLDQSRARHRRLQSILDETLVFQPRRRGDVDLLFTPGSAQQLRQLRPQLKFNGAADIPTYATADAWDGNRSGELDGLLFADMPWMIAPPTGEALRLATQLESAGDEPRRHGRLFAFGYDAWLLQASMRQRLATGPGDAPLRIDGVTGILSIGTSGVVQRELALARIQAGVAAPASP